MTAIKSQVIETITKMDDVTILSVWDMLVRHFNIPDKKITWDDIKEEEPDEIDLMMIDEIKTDPECNEYISMDALVAKRRVRDGLAV